MTSSHSSSKWKGVRAFFCPCLCVLILGRLHLLQQTPSILGALQVQLVVIPECGCRVGPLSTRVLRWGLLLRTAGASNSCDKCCSHGDGGRFSQTNNGRMFICGSPHLGRSACLPLSLDMGIGVCAFACLTQLFLSFSQWSVCLSPSFLMPCSQCLLFDFRTTQQPRVLHTNVEISLYILLENFTQVSITCCVTSSCDSELC